MEQYKFRNHGKYVRAQRAVTLRKLRRKRTLRCFAVEEVINAIRERHPGGVAEGICHGVRKGVELDMFQSRMGGIWIGTEIVEELCDGKRIFNMDFADLPDDWIGRFDILYSNSFDHARYPLKVAKAWLNSLAKHGRAYIEWTPWHDKLGRRGNVADCFAATEKEYREVLGSVGHIEDELVVESIGKNGPFNRRIFVLQCFDG